MADAATAAAQALPAEPWLKEIDAAIAREKEWRDRARVVVQRYRDKRGTNDAGRSKINILWSNTEVKRAALYARTAVPDIRRRFPDAKGGDKVARIAAEVLERALNYCNDVYDIDAPINDAVHDKLLPGRGVVWMTYEPEIDGDQITDQKLREEYVYWEDVCHGHARTWTRIPWWARRHALGLGEFKAKFPNARETPDISYQLKDADNKSENTDDKFVELWEIWDKTSKSRVYVARGFADEVARDPDPYHLAEFFPLPRPLYSVTTTDRLIPEPEFCQYQDQAAELDEVSGRIRVLLKQLVWKGIYDGSIDGENKLEALAQAGDGEFIAYQNWMALKDKGGIESAVGFWPVERIVVVLQQLFPRVEMLIQEIYQITGISDIMRGSTNANETAKAQQIKAQFGNMRINREQKDVQRFVRDLYRIKAEIIAEHFTEETLAAITNIDMPHNVDRDRARMQLAMMPPAPPPMGHNGGPPMGMGGEGEDEPPMMPVGAAPPMAPPEPPEDLKELAEAITWEDVMDLLRSDKLRSYRVDIETDSTIAVDAEAEKAGRIELVTAVQGMLSGAFQMITAAPSTIPLIEQVVMFALRSFKPGRALEEAFEEAFQTLKDSPPQPEQKDQKTGPDPAAERAKLDLENKRIEIDAEMKRVGLDIERAKTESDSAAKRASLDLEMEKLRIEKERLDREAIVQGAKIQSDQSAKDRELALAEREQAQRATMGERDLSLRAAAHNKAIVDETTSAAKPAGDGASPLDALAKSLEALATVVAVGQEKMARDSTAIIQSQTQATQSILDVLAAPKRLVRGADGRAIGVETVMQ